MLRKKFIFLLILLSLIKAKENQNIMIRYNLKMPKPSTHYFHVEMEISNIFSDSILVKMPVWAPGSYLVREFSKNVIEFEAKSGSQELVDYKINKNTWEIKTKNINKINISYKVYAYEQTVRTSFLNESRGYLNGSSIFMFLDGKKGLSGEVEITPPKRWKNISTGLPNVKNKKNTFFFQNFDELVDSPFLIGNHKIISFKLKNKLHEIALYGEGNVDEKKLEDDFKKIILTTSEIFGDMPYEKYLFIILMLDNKRGGLEHLNSTTVQADRWIFSEKRLYNKFLSTVAHEYFHTWNIKRIRPIELGPFDYDMENYTTELWVAEGLTSYYDNLLLLRSKILDTSEYFDFLSDDINSFEMKFGKNIQTLSESSFDSWIKYYRQNEESQNTIVSYYSKGSVIGLLLDLTLIIKSNGKLKLDDVFTELYKRYNENPDIGFTKDEFRKICEDFAGEKLDYIWKYVDSTDPIDYNYFLKEVGYSFEKKVDQDNQESNTPFMGFEINNSSNPIIKSILRNGPAFQAGLNVFDEIIAINNVRINNVTLPNRINDLEIGKEVNFLISREGILKELTLIPIDFDNSKYNFIKNENASQKNKEMFNIWLGENW